MGIGSRSRTKSNDPTSTRFDLLGNGHEIAIPADNNNRLYVAPSSQIFHRIEAQTDVCSIFCRRAGRKQLHQLHGVVQQHVAVAAKVLPIAVS